VVAAGTAQFGRLRLGTRSVNVEFVSANPTGPLHAGHGRWAAYGDALARLLEHCGHRVHREFYVNDRGTQMQIYAASLDARRDGRDLPEDGYAGQYIRDWAAEMPADADAREWGEAKALTYQADTLARMDVRYDLWASEKALVAAGAMDEALAELRDRGHVYDEDGATWLRTTTFGDDKDRVLIRTDGEPTYFLPDIAYHRDKYRRGELIVDILGSDHHGYIRRMAAAMEALGHPRDTYEPIIGQNVVLMRDGVEVRLSKRTGDIIELAELLDEIGPDATRFAFLSQSIDTKVMLDIDLLKQRSMDNPVFYVQMAHARLRSIARNAGTRGVTAPPIDDVDLSLLVHPRELTLIESMVALPTVVGEAYERRSPSKVVTWLRELAAAVHGFHHDCWVVADDVPLSLSHARLWLCEASRVALATGLTIVGVNAPEEM
jgi:arginyl-tRNA synthetase